MSTFKKLHVLNTRPVGQESRLTDALTQLGIEVMQLPLLEITATHHWKKRPLSLENFDYAIFTSANAVVHFFEGINSSIQWPQKALLFAIGQGTAEALSKYHLTPHFLPKEANSESMLELPHLKSVSGKKILLIKGVGGRQHLFKILRSRGALLQTCVVYRRRCPKAAASQFQLLWQTNTIDIILLTSATACRYLLKLIEQDKQREWLKQKTIVVISKRIAQTLKTVAVKQLIVTSYDNLLNTIKDFSHDSSHPR